MHLYGDRILPFDSEIALFAGRIADLAKGKGHAPGFADVIIAATGLHHGLTILTRNIRHFEPMEAPALDPFAALPDRPGAS